MLDINDKIFQEIKKKSFKYSFKEIIIKNIQYELVPKLIFDNGGYLNLFIYEEDILIATYISDIKMSVEDFLIFKRLKDDMVKKITRIYNINKLLDI